MQKKLNENFYLTTQQEIRRLALKSTKMSYGELRNDFNFIQEKVFWSNWGLQGNLTKKALIEYLDILQRKINKQKKGCNFFWLYLFDKQVKESRKQMHKIYNMDFKER